MPAPPHWGLLCPLQMCPRAAGLPGLLLCLTKEVAQTSTQSHSPEPPEGWAEAAALTQEVDAALEPLSWCWGCAASAGSCHPQPRVPRWTRQDHWKFGTNLCHCLLQVELETVCGVSV